MTHRHPQFWPNANDFDPNRFSSDRVASRPAAAYFPFILGPHECIGKDFEMLEMCLAISMIFREFDFDLAPNQEIHPVAALTLNPNSPILLGHRLVR